VLHSNVSMSRSIACVVSHPHHQQTWKINLYCPEKASVKWAACAAAALVSGSSGTYTPSTVTLGTSDAEVSPHSLVSDVYRESLDPLFTITLSSPTDSFLRTASLRSISCDTHASVLAANEMYSPKTLHSIANKSSMWSASAFASSQSYRASAVSLITAEKALAKERVQQAAERTEEGLSELMSTHLAKGRLLVSKMGPDTSKVQNEHRLGELWKVIRVDNLFMNNGGLEAEREACKKYLADNLGLLVDIYRFFSVPSARSADETPVGKGNFFVKPVNTGFNGSRLGMSLEVSRIILILFLLV